MSLEELVEGSDFFSKKCEEGLRMRKKYDKFANVSGKVVLVWVRLVCRT